MMASSQDNISNEKDAVTESKEDDSARSGDGFGTEQVDFLVSMLEKAVLAESEETHEKIIDDLSLKGIAEYINAGNVHSIIVMAGAGISTSAGIPDFRSPGSGLYHNLSKYNLPSPQAIFELSYFKENPEPFFQLAKELWPGIFKPTLCHYFIRLLHEKKLLLRLYTQNIDTLERVAGLDEDVIVEAHGTFHTGRCLECRHVYSQEWMKERIFDGQVPRCTQKLKSFEEEEEEFTCDGVVKPDIVFFGESLPPRFFACAQEDFDKCDLLIIMGTSLVVQPFASLVNRVNDRCLRLYINLEKAVDPLMAVLGCGSSFKFDDEDNYRDVFHQSTCDDGCLTLAELLGWADELKDLIKREHEKITKASSEQNKGSGTESTSSKPGGPEHKSEL